jgi:hypothetical protein
VGTEAARGKVCWITNAGVVRIGNNTVPSTMGFHPGTGCEVVVGNIWFENVVTTLTANVIPNATVGTRYGFTTTGGGVINIDKCDMAWYLLTSQAYSVNVSNSGFIDAISIAETAQPMTFDHVGVGNKPTTALVTSPLTLTYCYAGGTFTDCVFSKVTQASTVANAVYQDIANFTFTRVVHRGNTISGINACMSINGTRVKDCTWTDCTFIQGSINLITCDGLSMTGTVYVAAVSSTTVTTYTNWVWNLSSNTINSIFSGLTFPVTNTHPYTAILAAATGCANIKLRNIGTRAVPLSLGSLNACGLIYTLATNCADFKFQRLYFSLTRTGIMTGDNSSTRITEENVFGDYADAVDVMAVLNFKRKGMGGTAALTAQTSVYGSHWFDSFISATAGRINILMNEATSLTASYITLTGGSGFTSAGGLYMPNVGQTATFELDYYCLGHTRIDTVTPVMAGGTIGNYTFDYSIDLNDTNGFSTMTSAAYTAAALATALNAITTIDASKGFKLRLKITTGTANTTAITSLYLTTISTAAAQDYQYPLDSITLTLSGLQTGSDIVILQAGTTAVLTSVDAYAGTSWNYVYETQQNVDIGIIKPGYVPLYIRGYALSSSNATLPVSQVFDRSYS